MEDIRVNKETLIELIEESLGQAVERASITNETRFLEDLGMDSITLITLLFLCEEKYGLDLSDRAEEVSKLYRFGECIRFMQECQQNSARLMN